MVKLYNSLCCLITERLACSDLQYRSGRVLTADAIRTEAEEAKLFSVTNVDGFASRVSGPIIVREGIEAVRGEPPSSNEVAW